jgi:hypothetical protein
VRRGKGCLRAGSEWQIDFSRGDAMKTSVRADRIMKKTNLALFAVMFPLAALVACNRNNVQAAAPEKMPAPVVTVATATVQDVPRYLDEIGRNAAFESVTVTPQVGGRITERHFKDGENLVKGQLLNSRQRRGISHADAADDVSAAWQAGRGGQENVDGARLWG